MSQCGRSQTSQLIHFTPLRYPGGKAKLAESVKALLKSNRLLDGEYVEPYAGGAAIALELLLQEYVDRVHINDISRPVYSFWKAVLTRTEELCRLVNDKPLTVAQWDKQKAVFSRPTHHDVLELGFAMFYLNRTNRSGILNGGIIGGRDQTGPWKIDARYNAKELVRRIQAIASMKHRIRVTRKDALTLLREGSERWSSATLIYLDPPYYVKGRDLYHDFYEHDDHKRIANYLRQAKLRQRWIVSYDNVPSIRKFYSGFRNIIYSIGYSARKATQGSEIMFFCDELSVPSLHGNLKIVKENGFKSSNVA
ncbi:MAG TPA: DNA adenine methylase [Candidatus Aquilonibacter sp.]|nr:DNA adenine methylase [Candidatus Aquilonibacter sp.]